MRLSCGDIPLFANWRIEAALRLLDALRLPRAAVARDDMDGEIMPGGGAARGNDSARRIVKDKIRYGLKTDFRVGDEGARERRGMNGYGELSLNLNRSDYLFEPGKCSHVFVGFVSRKIGIGRLEKVAAFVILGYHA